MDDSVELKLLGITYNQIESGVYALILEEPVGKKRLAIVIGYPEAQSIECHLQNVRTPRPLTHDLMATLLSSLEARLLRVDIGHLPSGPYTGKLSLENIYGEIKELDARSSDAIALAIRVGAPIFTSRALLEEKGYSPTADTEKNDIVSNESSDFKWNKYSDVQLLKLIEQYVGDENYEAAAEIKIELERRKNKKD